MNIPKTFAAMARFNAAVMGARPVLGSELRGLGFGGFGVSGFGFRVWGFGGLGV